MKRLLLILPILWVMFVPDCFGQTPQYINYQAVLRNTHTGAELSNQSVFLIVKFLDDSDGGSIVYQEEHPDIQTNQFGLVNLKLGEGNPTMGSFEEIPWQTGHISLALEMDTGNGLEPLGNTEFSSVPYALFAANTNQEPDADSDPENEIQDLTLSGNILQITKNESANEIDLNTYANNPTDEIQDLSLSGNTLKITNNPSAAEIDLSPYVNPEPDGDGDSTNEIQDLFLSGNTLTITNNPDAAEIDLSQYVNPDPDGDGDSTNEIQDLSLSGNTLKITNNASAAEIDLSPYVNPDPDGDGDSTNEIQDLSLSGNTLKITNNASAAEIDLSPYVNPSLSSNKIFIGNASNVATPQTVSGDISINNTGTAVVKAIQNVPVANTTPNNGDALIYDGDAGEWTPKPVSTISPTNYYSVDPMDFVELTNPGSGIDLDKHNAVKYYNNEAPFAMIYNSTINTIGAPVHLPNNAVVSKVTFYVKNIGSGSLTFRLMRKKLTDHSLTNEPIVTGTAVYWSTDRTIVLTPNTFNLIDNSQYTYRILVTITDDENDKNEPVGNIQQIIYGAVIEYN